MFRSLIIIILILFFDLPPPVVFSSVSSNTFRSAHTGLVWNQSVMELMTSATNKLTAFRTVVTVTMVLHWLYEDLHRKQAQRLTFRYVSLFIAHSCMLGIKMISKSFHGTLPLNVTKLNNIK